MGDQDIAVRTPAWLSLTESTCNKWLATLAHWRADCEGTGPRAKAGNG